MLILVSKPFTDYVAGEGMVVGNMGRIVELPDNMADSRIDAGFGEESTQEAFDEQEAADAAAAEVEAADVEDDDLSAAPVAKPAAAPRGKRGPNKPKAIAASPVTAPVA